LRFLNQAVAINIENNTAMKGLLIVSTSLIIAGALAFYVAGRKGPSVGPPDKAAATVVAARDQKVEPRTSDNVAAPTQTHSLRSKKPLLEHVDDFVVSEIGISPEERSRLKELFERSRSDMLVLFAAQGELRVSNAKSAELAVALPAEEAKRLRSEFYRNVERVLGSDRTEWFLRLQNVPRFEANFMFFGEFPIVYEFDGDGATLASSEQVMVETTVAKRDQHGRYDAYWGQTLPMQPFKDAYGAVADRVLGRSSN
jgi:hypothetical protein